MTVIPDSQTVSAPTGQTSQFLAIGTTSSGATVNLTDEVAWSSSSKLDCHDRGHERVWRQR